MEFKESLYSQEDGVATITLNRPEKLNSFDPQMYEEFSKVATEVSRDDDIRVIILTGSGRAFSAGADFKRRFQAEIDQKQAGQSNITHKLPSYPNGMTDLTFVRQPIIAAINGFAIGVGFNYALQCDIRIASDKARIRLPFTQLGQTPEAFPTYYLPRLIGLGKAFELWFTSRWVEADEALSIGLVNKVVPPGELEAATLEWCRKILSKSPTALRFMKAALNADTDHVYGLQAIAHGATHLFYGTEESKEGREAWKAKREPDFSRFRRTPW